jgi:hypothetical protein
MLETEVEILDVKLQVRKDELWCGAQYIESASRNSKKKKKGPGRVLLLGSFSI